MLCNNGLMMMMKKFYRICNASNGNMERTRKPLELVVKERKKKKKGNPF
jgi:hypothetical protein